MKQLLIWPLCCVLKQLSWSLRDPLICKCNQILSVVWYSSIKCLRNRFKNCKQNGTDCTLFWFFSLHLKQYIPYAWRVLLMLKSPQNNVRIICNMPRSLKELCALSQKWDKLQRMLASDFVKHFFFWLGENKNSAPNENFQCSR